MKRVNLTMSDKQYRKIVENADAIEVKPGTFCKLAAFSAAGIQSAPDIFTMPTKIKQLSLFEKGKKV